MVLVGHCCTGVALALLSMPGNAGKKRVLVTCGVFAVLANAPDIPLPGWGHDIYEVSHSFFCNFVWMLPLLLAFRVNGKWREWVGGWRVVLTGIVVVFGHLVLDAMYNHGLGLVVWWPVSYERIVLPVPWLDPLRQPPEFWHTLGVLGVEFLTFGPLVGLAYWWRWGRSGLSLQA